MPPAKDTTRSTKGCTHCSCALLCSADQHHGIVGSKTSELRDSALGYTPCRCWHSDHGGDVRGSGQLRVCDEPNGDTQRVQQGISPQHRPRQVGVYCERQLRVEHSYLGRHPRQRRDLLRVHPKLNHAACQCVPRHWLDTERARKRTVRTPRCRREVDARPVPVSPMVKRSAAPHAMLTAPRVRGGEYAPHSVVCESVGPRQP